MKKRFYLIPASLMLLSCVVFFILNNQTHTTTEHAKTLTSAEIIQGYINKKIERRKNGYAKPDKPNKYVEYQQTLVTGSGKKEYKRNHKLEELKSAVAHKASLKSAKVSLPWIQRGPGNIGGRTRSIIVDPTDPSGKTWFAGAVSGGIWKTLNAGDSWEIISPDLPNLATVCLAMAPSNSNIIYAGTGEGYYNIDAVRGNGIFKSDDKGVTWTQLESTKEKSGFYYVNSIVISHNDENTLWAATNSGVVKSTDGGSSWYTAGAQLNQRYQRIIIHPSNDNILWVTRNNKGIYKTEDGGKKWFLVHDMTGAGRIEITVSAAEPTHLYAIDEESNMYYSHDGGTEWAKATEATAATNFLGGQGWYNSVLAVNPNNVNNGFIGGIDLYRFSLGAEIANTETQSYKITNTISSTLNFAYFGGNYSNGGISILSEYNNKFDEIQIQFGADKTQKSHQLKKKATAEDFTKVLSNDLSKLEYTGYIDVPFEAINTTTGEKLHTSFIDHNNNGKFDVYEDGYEVILIHNVTYSPTLPQTSVQSNNGNYKLLAAVYPYLAEGASWDSNNLPQGYISINSYNLKDRTLTTTKISNWSATTSSPTYSHADHHNLTIANGEGDNFSIIVGNDGGVGYSTNSGATWVSKSNGYVTSQFYGITRHPKQYKYFGGMQDNGSALSGDNPNKLAHWQDLLGGDGFDVVWHPRKPDMIIGTYYYNQLRKSEDGGSTWANIGALIGDNGDGEIAPFVTRIASCQADPNLLFTGGASGLWKSTNFGDSWKNISMGANWGYTSNSSPKIAISEANPDIVWAGIRMNSNSNYTTGKLQVSTDGGETFTALHPFMNMGPITNLLTHPTEPNTAYMLFSFSNFPKIFRTEDLGQTWEDISGFGLSGRTSSINGFPNVAVNTLIVMPFNTNEIWAGTEIGLFISLDNGASWSYADNGIPAVSIWDIKIVGDEVILGTHGLGVWTVKMNELSNNIKNPYIINAGINPRGDIILNTTYESQLDSFELYTDKGWVKTYYTIAAQNRIDTISRELESSTKVFIYGYLSGKRYSSNIVNLPLNAINQPQTMYVNDFSDENKLNDFTGLGFSITESIFNNNAIHSPHPYPENTDLYYTLKYPIIVSKEPSLAFIKYYDIAYIETGEEGTVYPEENFYDYVVVEATKDGLNWKALSPGYDFSYNTDWSANGNTYTNTPKASDYVDHHINLYDAFEPEDTILVRFKLHSDPFQAGWGWAIDNIRIQGSISGVNNEDQDTFETKIYPNPVNNSRITVQITDKYIGTFEIGIYDVSGQQLAKQSYFKDAQAYQQQVTLPQLPSGIYLIKVRMNNYIKTEKLWVE